MPTVIDFLETASAATCAAIAQILPVFMVALVAERIARLKDPEALAARVMLRTATAVRILFDFALAACLLGLTILALVGIEARGLVGQSAHVLWVGTIVLGIAILYRWLLVSTPLLSLTDDLGQAWGRLVTKVLTQLTRVIPVGMNRVVDIVGRFVQVASELLFGVLAAGMSTGIVSIADWMTARIARRSEHRGGKDVVS